MSWNEKSLHHARAARRRQRTGELPILLSALLSSASIAALVLIPKPAEAQTTNWVGTTSAYNTASNWSIAIVPAAPGQFAVFGNTGSSAISVSSPVAPDGWVISGTSQPYSITGSAVTFGTATGVLDQSRTNISIANSLGGGGRVTQQGAGTLTLTGANTYIGGTVISAGTLQISGSGTLGNTGNSLLVTDGTLDLGGTAQAQNGGAEIDGGTVQNGTLSSSNQFTFKAPATATISAALAGRGNLVMDGPGTTVLSGNNSNAGNTTIFGGTLSISSDVNLGGTGLLVAIVASNGTTPVLQVTQSATINRPFFLTGNASVDVSPNQTVTISGPISNDIAFGAGTLVKADTGTLVLTGANTYSAGTTINAGTLQISGSGTLGAASNILLINGGTLDLGGTSQTQNGGLGLIAGTIQNGTLSSSGAFALASGTISAVLAGAGGVDQNGSGTSTLSGANTYTGPTIVNAGTLQISGSGTLGNTGNFLLVSGGTLDLGGTTQIANGGVEIDSGTVRNGTLSSSSSSGIYSYVAANTTATIGAALAGGGGLNIQPSSPTSPNGGTLMLSGNNSYTGGTFVGTGTLSVSSDSNLGAAGSSVSIDAVGTQSATVQLTQSSTFNRPFFIAGNASIGVSPNQTATITGVIADDPNFIHGTLNKTDAGTLVLTSNNTYSGGTTISAGTLQVGNGGTTGTLGSGPITDNGTLAFNRSDNVLDVSAISGSGGVTQAGSGTLILDGVNTFTGTTTVANGRLEVGDVVRPGATVAGNVLVGPGANLGGHGTVGGAVTNNGGTVTPGGSIGTLTVGSFSQNASGTLALEVSPAQASELKVTGAASLNGALVLTPDAGTYSVGQTFTLVDSKGGISGTFSSLSLGSYGSGIAPVLNYAPNDVVLTLAQSFVPLATTPNQLAAANGIMAGGPASSLYNSMEALTMANPGAVPDTLGQLAGDIRPSLRAAAIEDSRVIRDTLLDHMDHAGHGISLWGMGLAGYGRLASDGNAANLHHGSAGFLAGADMPVLSAVTLGIDAGYTVNSARTPGRLSTASGDSGHVGAYAVWSLDDIRLDIGGDYGFGHVTINRAVPALSATAASSQDQETGQVFADLGYRVALERVQLEPHAQIAHVTATGGAFAETGSTVAALSGNEKSDSATYSLLGLRANTADFALGDGMTLSPRLDLGWQHALARLTPYQIENFANAGTSFLVLGTPLAEDAAALQAGFDFKLGHSLMLSVSYDGSFSSTVENHAFRGGLTWRF